MNFNKLIMLSLLSLSMYSSVYSMDNQASSSQSLTLEQINQVKNSIKNDNDDNNNWRLAVLAGFGACLATNVFPIEQLFFERYKSLNPAWEFRQRVGLTSLLSDIIYGRMPEKYIYPTIFTKLKFIASLGAAYKAYKLVRSKK